MDFPLEFVHQEKNCHCQVYIDVSLKPYYFFIALKDADLVAEFGEEVTIKTDFEQNLVKRVDYPALHQLKENIFQQLTTHKEFIQAKAKLKNRSIN